MYFFKGTKSVKRKYQLKLDKMYLNILNRICNILPLYFILLWMSLLNGQILTTTQENEGNTTLCETDFETNFLHCLDGLYFYKWHANILNFHRSPNLFREILKRHFCRQYTTSLQCIHEILAACRTDNTTGTVHIYLSQPWALQYNTFCDINQQHPLIASQNISIAYRNTFNASQNNSIEQSGIKSKLNNTLMQRTVNKITKKPTNRINRLVQLQQKTEVSRKSDDHFNNRDFGSRQSSYQTGNTRDKFLSHFLFYRTSIKPENSFQTKQQNIEYHLLFQKLTSDKSGFSIQSAVLRNQRVKEPSERQVEMLIEIQG